MNGEVGAALDSGASESSAAQGVESAAAEVKPVDLKITAKEAAELVRGQSPTALLALLKKPEHSDAVKRVFAGYRVNLDSLKLPLARGRLASELVTNTKLLDAVLGLPSPAPATASPAGTAPAPSKIIEAKPLPPAPGAVPHPDQEAARAAHPAADRDTLRQELRKARAAFTALQNEEANTRRLMSALQAGLADTQAKLAAEQAAGAWRERRLRRLECELAESRQNAVAIAKRPMPGSGNEGARSQSSVPPHVPSALGASPEAMLSATLFEALDRLLSRGKFEPARLLADEMLHGNPGNIDALRIRALTRLAQGDRPGALQDTRSIFEASVSRHDTLQAARAMLRWMAISGVPDAKMAQSLYAAVSRDGSVVVAELRDALLGLRDGKPEQYAMLRSWCQPALAALLFAGDDEQSGRAMLPLPLTHLMGYSAWTTTPKRLIAAIDANEESMVNSARAALPKVEKRVQEQALAAINEAADGDESYGRLLSRRVLSGSAIVDASNVAQYERDLMPSARPLLSNIAAVRRALRERGYFPVQIVADANLPHIIDSPDQLWGLVQRGEVELVAGGTVADELIVREAKRTGAAIVSNDYMADWDPAGELVKLQYSVSLTDGRASLYE